MKLLSCIIFLLLSQDVFSAEISSIITKLGSELESERNEAGEELMKQALKDVSMVAIPLGEEWVSRTNPEISARADRLLKRLFQAHVHGLSQADCGLKLGWFLDQNNNDLSSFPLVLEVAKGSAGEKSGLRPGDAIIKWNNESCRSVDSRNVFLTKLLAAPEGTEVSLLIKRSNVQKIRTNNLKGIIKKITLTTKFRKLSKSNKDIDRTAIKLWLEELKFQQK